MYGSQAWVDWLPYICLLFSGFSNVCHFTGCIWPTALKLGCITNVDMLFLTMGFICLSYENKFMLVSGGHISNRSIIIITDRTQGVVFISLLDRCFSCPEKHWETFFLCHRIRPLCSEAGGCESDLSVKYLWKPRRMRQWTHGLQLCLSSGIHWTSLPLWWVFLAFMWRHLTTKSP